MQFLEPCDPSKKIIENSKALVIPEDCYLRMKLRKEINTTTLEANKKYLESLGVNKYNNLSIVYSNVAKTVELVVLVITRWNDTSKRMSLRKTLGSFGKGKT